MKAPEKIYLLKRNKLPSEVVRDKWYEADPQNIYGSVEYTRTDAFIEKAVQYLKDHKEDVETEDNGIAGWIPDYFIKDFENYMKGE